MKNYLPLVLPCFCMVAALQADSLQKPNKQYVAIAATQGNQRAVRVYRVNQTGTVEMLDDAANAKTDWQAIGVPLRAEQKCVGLAAVRISSKVIRLYRALADGSVHILDDGGNPKNNNWQAIGVNSADAQTKCVGVSAVRISQRVVRVYRSLDNGKVDILDDGGNPNATWQALRK